MSDQDRTGDVDVGDLAAIGGKVVGMARRLQSVKGTLPELQARWVFAVEGDLFEVVVTLDRSNALFSFP